MITPAVGVLSNPDDIVADVRGDFSDRFFIQAGNIDNANGSCYMEVGNGQILLECSVYGPRPINNLFVGRGSFSVETKFLPNVHQPGNPEVTERLELSGVEQKLLLFVETSLLPLILLEKYPKLTIDVFVLVIGCDEGTPMWRLAAWMVNCALVAIVDAEIEVRDIVTLGYLDMSAASFMTLADDGIVGMWLDGNSENVEKVLEVCQQKAKDIRANINLALLSQS